MQNQQPVPYGRPALFLALANSIGQKNTSPPPPREPPPPPYTKTETSMNCCPCYQANSSDARCCGLCYYCAPTPIVKNQCNFCPNNVSAYCNSGYIITQATGQPEKWDDCDCCCTLICLPVKFSCFFPCFFGSMCNNCINYTRDTDLNYLW